MVQELWKSFPRLLEQNLNGLLETAEPNPALAYRLYKTCKLDGLWDQNFEVFSTRLVQFYLIPRSERRKSHFDYYLNRPLSQDQFAQFHINFRTAEIAESSIHNLATWAHHLIRRGYKRTLEVASVALLRSTFFKLTRPGPLEKAEDLTLSDFFEAWEGCVFRTHGRKFEFEFKKIRRELERMDEALKAEERLALLNGSASVSLELSQTDLDWVQRLRDSVKDRLSFEAGFFAQKFESEFLKDLLKAGTLYHMLAVSSRTDLISQRERVRNTILKRCDFILQRVLLKSA